LTEHGDVDVNEVADIALINQKLSFAVTAAGLG
jgi:hypothetical protein